MEKNLYISELLDVYGEILNEKPKKLCEYYYNDDLSLAEISELVGITRQGVQDQIKRAESRLMLFEKKCHYCEWFIKLKEQSEKAKNGDKNALNEIFNIIDNL